MRGEDSGRLMMRRYKSETPPRAWGRRCWSRWGRSHAGNTPTCVGKTRHAQCHHGRAEKHPHVRGEDCQERAGFVLVAETPPRAWGRPPARPLEPPTDGNTPTCVGKTRWWWGRCPPAQKHPHVRGEDKAWAWWCPATPETPPRAWGRLPSPEVQLAIERNTPTCVGKTLSRQTRSGP